MTNRILVLLFCLVFVFGMFSVTVNADLEQTTPGGANAILYCKTDTGQTLYTKYYYGTALSSQTITAPAISGYTPDPSTIKITCGLFYTREHTITYTPNTYTLTVNYKYSNGTTAYRSHTQSIKFNEWYSINSPFLSGYSWSKSMVSGYMGAGNKTYDIIYTPKDYTLTVNYEYATGGTAATSKTQSVSYGSSYSVSSPTVSGYTPNKTVISGTMGKGDETYTVTYTKNAPVNYTLTIYYKYADGGTAASTYTKTMEKGSSYSVSSPSVSGYTADKSTVSGTLNSNTTVTVTYTKNPATKYTLTIYYKYSSGGTAATTYTTTQESGYSYNVTSPTVSGYTPDKTMVSGTLTSNKTVTVTYTQKVTTPTTYTLTIYYKDTSGNTVAARYSASYTSGSYYSVSSPSVSGYTADISTVSGYIYSNTTKTVTYTENEPDPVYYTLTIYYKDESGNTLATRYSASYTSGSYYSVSSPSVSGYTPNTSTVSGYIYSNTTKTVTYTADEPDPVYYTLTINYKDTSGNTLATQYYASYESGSYYSVTSPTVSGYTADTSVVSGYISGNTTKTVTYTKDPVYYTLTINYKDTNGNTIATRYQATYESGSYYNVSSPSINGYTPDYASISGYIGGNITKTVIYTRDRVNPEVRFEGVEVSSAYRAGTTVISSFKITNIGESVTPYDEFDIPFSVYYMQNGTRVTIASDIWEDYVIPAGEDGYIYFRWTVPANLAGKTVYCHIEYGDYSDTFTNTVISYGISDVPDTRYEDKEPSWYYETTAGEVPSMSAEWYIWEYANDEFEKVVYGITVNTSASITPDPNVSSATYTQGKWHMGSGYGFSINASASVSRKTGCTLPSSDSYTSAQYAYALLPDYMYSADQGEHITLEKVSGAFVFYDKSSGERFAYTPVWYPDGGYTVKVVLTDVWTPAGCITVSVLSNEIVIDGTMFDDWYIH